MAAWSALPAEMRRGRIFASPAPRRLAGRERVPLAALQATGPQHMIVERDVQAYLEQQRSRPRITPLARRVARGRRPRRDLGRSG